MSTDTEQTKVSEDLGQVNKPQQQVNIAESVESYQKAIELNPNSVPALSELAQIAKEQKKYEPAFSYYLKLVSLRPKKPSFFQSLVRVSTDYAKVLLKKNALERAIAAYQEFLNKKLPKNGNLDKIDRICQTLGESIHQLSIRQGEFSPATTFFQEAIEKFPYKVWSYYHLGNILAQQDQLDEAIACCEKAVEIRPKFSLGLLLLGTLVLKKGYLDQAFQCGLKILEYQGRFKNIELNYNLIKLLSIQSDNKQSQEALQKTIEKIETSSVQKPKLKLAVYRNIAKILRNRNNLDKATDFYQKSLCFLLQKSKPEFVENHWEEGKLQAPDFSVIGLAKCGTTAFYDYLCQHPQVLPAVEKEPMYLYHWLVKSKDFETRDWSLPSAEKDFYLAHFATRPEGGHFMTGEASTTNILPGCDKIMSSWFPNIKLIVILREPVRRTISHYEELLKLGNQKGTLEEIINLELDQLEASTNIGQTAIKKLRRRGWKEHIAMSLYVYPLERWMNLFPREQFLILTNEELAQYPEETMNQAFDFLGLPECNSIEYHPRNVGSYPQLDAKLLDRLSNFFRPHNQRLEELLGRKFNWDNH